MTTPPKFGAASHLAFHGPLSTGRADRLVAYLAAREPATVVDYGSGWGELLLRLLAAVPEARGTGVDVHGPDIARGRALAAERGLGERVTFVEGPAADHTEAADLVVSLGAYQAFGTIPEALKALRGLVNPGGRLLFGCEIWERTPTAAELAAMWPGTTVEECLYLPDELREKLDEHLSIWLRGTHDVLGFAYLTLGVPG